MTLGTILFLMWMAERGHREVEETNNVFNRGFEAGKRMAEVNARLDKFIEFVEAYNRRKLLEIADPTEKQ